MKLVQKSSGTKASVDAVEAIVNMDHIKLLECQKEILSQLNEENCDLIYRLHNASIICDNCPYYDKVNRCILYLKPAYEVRESPVRCSKHPKYRKKTKKQTSMWKIFVAIIDSISINEFYPLKAAMRGESYELKKTVPESCRRGSSETENKNR